MIMLSFNKVNKLNDRLLTNAIKLFFRYSLIDN